MSTGDEAYDAIEDQLAQPKSATGDFGSWTNRSLDELIKLDKYLRARRAKQGFRLRKIIPPGGGPD